MCSGLLEVANNWTRIGCSISNHNQRPELNVFLDNLPNRDLIIDQQGFNISGKNCVVLAIEKLQYHVIIMTRI